MVSHKDPPPGAPRWVKALAAVALALVVAIAVVLIVSGGEHGPGRHLPSGGDGGHTAPEGGHRPPGGGTP